jgi:hypothetical protein
MAETTTGRDVDERAKAILATRLAVSGQPADRYSESEYAEALIEAQAAIDAERSGDESAKGAGADAVRAAILATGLANAPEADTTTRLLAHAHELIREQGYRNGEWGDVELQSGAPSRRRLPRTGGIRGGRGGGRARAPVAGHALAA